MISTIKKMFRRISQANVDMGYDGVFLQNALKYHSGTTISIQKVQTEVISKTYEFMKFGNLLFRHLPAPLAPPLS